MHRILLKGLGHLNGKLARGHQYQGLRTALPQIEPRQQRQRERRRLAGTGLCLPEDIRAGEQHRNRRRLDGRRGLVAHVEHRLQYRVFQTQVGKGSGIGRV